MPKNCSVEQDFSERPKVSRAKFAGQIAMGSVLGLAIGSTLVYGGNVTINNYINVAERASGPLPAAVAAQVSQAVHVQVYLPSAKHENGNNSPAFDYRSELSGTSLGNGFFLSAGHGIVDRRKPISSEEECAKVIISGHYQGWPYKVQSAGNIAKNSNDREDLAVYKITEGVEYSVTGKFGKHLPPGPPVATKPLREGEIVYFVNWEPTADGKARDPNAQRGLNTPAIFPGVVIKAGDLPQAVTDIQSLGRGVPDKVGRGGISGGPVLNSGGQLVGLSNYYKADVTWVDQLFDHHIGPFGLPGDGKERTLITPVIQAQIASLEAQAQQAAVC